jgi:aminopeptidase
MAGSRVTKLAELLTKYSLRVRKGDYALLRGSAVAEPIIRECYRHAVRAGANGETTHRHRRLAGDSLCWLI